MKIPATGSFNIIVKANKSKNKIIGYDKEKKAFRIEIKAKPENNKANIEIIKFLSKQTGKKVKILKGLTNKQKSVRIEES